MIFNGKLVKNILKLPKHFYKSCMTGIKSQQLLLSKVFIMMIFFLSNCNTFCCLYCSLWSLAFEHVEGLISYPFRDSFQSEKEFTIPLSTVPYLCAFNIAVCYLLLGSKLNDLCHFFANKHTTK